MECKICHRALAKNGIKKGVQYYYCTHCKRSYSLPREKPKTPEYLIYEEYITRALYQCCVKQKNKLTDTYWNINQIARLLEHRYLKVQKWINNQAPLDVCQEKLQAYLAQRKSGSDILCLLGMRPADKPSPTILAIITKKKRPKSGKAKERATLEEPEYLHLVNLPIETRKEAIFVLGALLGCRTNEIIGFKYSDVDYQQQTIRCNRVVTFDKGTSINERDHRISHRTYPLTRKMISIIEWLKTNREQNKARLKNKFNAEYFDFLCVQENGDFINSFSLNTLTQSIIEKVEIDTRYDNGKKLKPFQFRWLRTTVRKMMSIAGVPQNDIVTIYKYYKGAPKPQNMLEIMRNAYEILDKYINEHRSE